MTYLNTKSVKKAMKAYGINAMVGVYKHNTAYVRVSREDVEKTKAFFNEFDIKRLTTTGLVDPFSVNGGEFNSLVAAV